jgi:hypothetical protein
LCISKKLIVQSQTRGKGAQSREQGRNLIRYLVVKSGDEVKFPRFTNKFGLLETRLQRRRELR